MKTYYNEIDPHASAWLRQLISMGLIADGDVDERSIIDVQATDLKGYSRLHFFAGIAGWDKALQLANWPIDKPVVTASLPCQSFSIAGKGLGKNDERHLLPYFMELVAKCDWPVIFGEQVPAAINHGWADDLKSEMNALGYETAMQILAAPMVGTFHIRERLYWVAKKT